MPIDANESMEIGRDMARERVRPTPEQYEEIIRDLETQAMEKEEMDDLLQQEGKQVRVVKASNPKDAIGSKKAPLSVLPFPPLYEVAAGMLEGACKYRRHNYRAIGVRASVYFDAALRHLTSWWEGENTDPTSGIHHVSKAIAGLLVARDSMMQGNFHDDRPPRAQEGWEGDVQDIVDAVLARYPDPLPPYTIGGEPPPADHRVEVHVPTDPGPGGVWVASAIRGLDRERALRHAEGLRRERGCAVRIMRGDSELVAIALPGDPPLTELG